MNRDYTIQATCLMPARLIHRALEQGARFESIRLSGKRRMVAACDAQSARILLSLCERYSVPAKVLRRGGRSGMLAFLRERRTLPLGIAVFLMLCAAFLSRIWWVDVTLSGENAQSEGLAMLRSAIHDAGIAPGIGKRGIDPGLLAQRLTALGRYSYVGTRIQGVRLLVEAVPEVSAPAVYDVDAARDLVAGMDGIVVRAVARAGQLCVKPGDAVRRGQVLIRGEELATKDETRPIAALGEVVVRAWVTGRASLPLSRTERRPTGRVSFATSLTTPWQKWPIVEGDAFDQQTEDAKRLPIGGLFIPVEIERVVRREMASATVAADRTALEARLAALAFADAAMRLCLNGPEGCGITDSWVNYEQTPGAMRAIAIYEIQSNAAVEREVLQGG